MTDPADNDEPSLYERCLAQVRAAKGGTELDWYTAHRRAVELLFDEIEKSEAAK